MDTTLTRPIIDAKIVGSETTVDSDVIEKKVITSTPSETAETGKKEVIKTSFKSPDQNEENQSKYHTSIDEITYKEIQKKTQSKNYEGLKERSVNYYQKALELLGKQNDSALYYANAANSCFENGSIFRVKAEAFYNVGSYSSASVACDICISRNDHWDIKDRDRCSELKCISLKRLYEKYPSMESKGAYQSACSSYGNPPLNNQ